MNIPNYYIDEDKITNFSLIVLTFIFKFLIFSLNLENMYIWIFRILSLFSIFLLICINYRKGIDAFKDIIRPLLKKLKKLIKK